MTAEHMTEGPHDLAAYRITKQMVTRMVDQFGEDSEIAEAAKTADNLLELASCPHCSEHVPDMVAVMSIMPDAVVPVILHLLNALHAANRGLIKAANNYSDLPENLRSELRKVAGHEPTPDYAPSE